MALKELRDMGFHDFCGNLAKFRNCKDDKYVENFFKEINEKEEEK